MIITIQSGTTDAQLDRIREHVEALGLRTHLIRGEFRTVVGCIGDEMRLREVPLLSLPGVVSVLPVQKPYKLASREFAASRTTVRLDDAAGTIIGGASSR